MAAEVDFGDRELFQQLEADEEAPSAGPGPAEEAADLRERLRDSEETVRQLRAENILQRAERPPPPRWERLAGRAGSGHPRGAGGVAVGGAVGFLPQIRIKSR